MSRHRIVWLTLWLVVLIAIGFVARYADALFMRRMMAGAPKPDQIFNLIPEDASALIYDQNLEDHWKRFKKSDLFFSLKNLSVVREWIDQGGVSDAEWNALEKWGFRFLGQTAVLSYSEKTNSLFLFSPIGNYEESLEWFQRLEGSSFRRSLDWKFKRLGEQWVFEYSRNIGSGRSFVIQWALVQGIAVLAVSEKGDPMSAIINASLHSTAFSSHLGKKFLEKTRSRPDQISGFIRMPNDERSKENLGIEWVLDVQSAGKIKFEIKAPVPSIQKQMTAEKNSVLAALRQTEDQISLYGSWEDFKMVWGECNRCLPKKWTEPISALKTESMLGSYQKIWNPVWEKLGDNLFISLGEIRMFSDKFRIPFPDVTLAIPFTDKELFLKALEKTVQKANAEQDANLVIRKMAVGETGYYGIKMGRSSWQQILGLKQFPVIAFEKDLLIISSDTGSMEKILQKLNQETKLTPELVCGVDFRMNLRQAPQTVQILLGALGAFNSEGDNVFLSPMVMHFMSEMNSVMKSLNDSRFILTYEPGFVALSGELLLN